MLITAVGSELNNRYHSAIVPAKQESDGAMNTSSQALKFLALRRLKSVLLIVPPVSGRKALKFLALRQVKSVDLVPFD